MKWEKCTLLSSRVNGVDALGNAVTELAQIRHACCRFTPMSPSDLILDGRTVMKDSRKLLVRIPYALFPQCESVCISGAFYSIKEKTDLQRFTMLFIERRKE